MHGGRTDAEGMASRAHTLRVAGEVSAAWGYAEATYAELIRAVRGREGIIVELSLRGPARHRTIEATGQRIQVALRAPAAP